MIFKKTLATISLGLLLFVGFAAQGPVEQSYACGRNNDDKLFAVAGQGGILPWHYYLDCDGANGISQDIELNQLWLIGIAIFESMLFIGGILSVIFVMWGGVKYITSQGNPEATSTARKTLINALAGLVITVSSSVVVGFIMSLLAPGGLDQGNALNIPGVEPDNSFIEGVLDFAYAVIALVSLIFVLIGSIKFATSTGNPEKAASARNTIIYALVGLVVVLIASIISGYVLSRV